MSEAATEREVVPSVLAYATHDKGRDLLRRTFTRRRARLLVVRTAEAAAAALRASLVDAVVVDVSSPGDETWAVAALARELPSIPFFALAPPRPARTQPTDAAPPPSSIRPPSGCRCCPRSTRGVRCWPALPHGAAAPPA